MGSASKRYEDEQWLRREYTEKNRSAPDIASEFDVSASSVYHFVYKYDLPPGTDKQTLECSRCGAEIERTPSQIKGKDNLYCSKDCAYSHRTEMDDWGSWSVKPKREIECAWCGDTREVHQSYPVRERYYCDYDCFGAWKSVHQSGENHPDWRGGWEEYYGPDWSRTRREALERDGYECTICGKGKPELGKHPDVHHIIPVMDHDDPNDANTLDNVVTLCRKHHSLVEGWGIIPESVRS